MDYLSYRVAVNAIAILAKPTARLATERRTTALIAEAKRTIENLKALELIEERPPRDDRTADELEDAPEDSEPESDAELAPASADEIDRWVGANRFRKRIDDAFAENGVEPLEIDGEYRFPPRPFPLPPPTPRPVPPKPAPRPVPPRPFPFPFQYRLHDVGSDF